MTPEEAREWRRKSAQRYQETRRRPPSARRKPLTPQQLRRAARGTYYRQQRDMRLVRARGRCELQLPGCTQTATETHHVIKRSHHLVDDVDNLRASCHSCNQRVETHPAEARALGFVGTDWPRIGE